MHSRTSKTVLIWAMPWSFGLQFHDPILRCHAGYMNLAILAVLAVFAAKVTPTATNAIAATTGGTCAKKTEPHTANMVGTRQSHF